MDPYLYKAAKEGDLSCLSEIDGRNITEEEAMRIQRGIFLKRTQHGNNNILHIAARAGRDTFVAEALRRFPFLSDQVNSQAAPVSSALVKEQGVIIGKGKRHAFRGQRNVINGDNDKSSSQAPAPEIVGQTDKSSAAKENHSADTAAET
ncbi:hypothetical protein RHGRI_009701 [Rhododendron griersonianum]|uniref:Ankyrin repeat family protein n=1 Tax=Rhododendron griersonianum TaxID=479676 RepID=A0AAV6KGI5_9ERIC|nr:hypothetical protein RHGRI_009701 [Rhododendron griersonianum]